MKRQLPPLNALRSFEAAARNLSFTKAAEELCVTQAAVSHQMRLLSDFLHVSLFRRVPSGFELTDQGKELYEVTRRSLDSISAVAERLMKSGQEQENTLVIRVTPFFSHYRLAPKIASFLARCPDITPHTVIGREPINGDLGRYDIIISHDEGDWPDIQAYPVLIETMVPICSPQISKSLGRPVEPSDISQMVLIRDVYNDKWGTWLSAAGLGSVVPRRMIVTDDPHFAVETALRGEGIFLDAPIFVQQHLDSGALMLPFGDRYPVPIRYMLRHSSKAAKKRKIRLFRDWALHHLATN
ncbi:LysR family transcriptional regulator [Hypericibacter adhaerens]|uniref:LysR family transcriptional regulator n=1 Tax=Hypericibacter adhaerens TaxID=2602016 RepID=A0A5J6MTZ7_9PROT|nr:LysR substrate-binding domain-containing protein [Hypericibacter adhaerens]QEX20215.1 LysR family transcriptional regulator [Hypericibacter adhaerens]